MPSEGFLLFLSTIYLCCVLLVCTVVDLRRFVIPNGRMRQASSEQ